MNRAIFRVLLVVLALTTVVGAQGGRKDDHWVGTWATAVAWRPAVTAGASAAPPVVPAVPTTPPPAAGATTAAPPPAPPPIANQTLRQIVHVSLGGSRVRVQFSNTFGTAPIEIGAANVAVRTTGAAIVPSSSRALRFAGQTSVVIPAGAVMTSDPVELVVAPLSDLAIDLFLPGDTSTWPSPLTTHGTALQDTYASESGNHAGEVTFTSAAPARLAWFLLSRVEVMAPKESAAIVTVGDSITDGTRSTPNTNHRWPDELARRLAANRGTSHLAVLNAGISGNRLLSELTPAMGINLLARFDRDVLTQPGVKYVVVLEGINDIGMRGQTAGPSAAQLIAAHQQIIERAHTQGLKIFGATLTPFEGAAYFTPEGETKRQAVNEWIRTSKWYDGVIDFDKVTRDPANPTKLLPAFNSGDNLHPSDAGYKAMGEAVDLGLFK
jgi:lysophospholipase L1-like esterase